MKRSSRFSQVLYTLSLAFLAFGLFNLAWAVWPPPTDAIQIMIPAGSLPAAPESMLFISLSEYALNISWPRWLRQGESGTLHLVLTDLDHSPRTVEQNQLAQVILAEPAIYPMQIDPLGGIQAILGDDQELLLAWEVAGEEQGSFPGKIFVSFGFYDEPTEELVTVPVAVVDIYIQVVTLWGRGAGFAIGLGVVSLVLWGVLFILGRVVAK
ncbi:MAG: hypothetical protein K0B06_11270 [Brevefilum sp.]|nr:hypothetical protein [Brevefilum sp.]